MGDSNLRSVASWVLQQKAGSGSFAVVWKAAHKETGNVVAIKEISTDRLNKKLKQSLESEVSILKQIRHKNIVHLEDVVEVLLIKPSFVLAQVAIFLSQLSSLKLFQYSKHLMCLCIKALMLRRRPATCI